MIKVMIADDQELIRESLQIVLGLNEDLTVTGLAKNGAELLELIEENVPDVVLMDVRMPETDGVMATKEIKARYPNVKIIILTTFDDDEYVYNALKYGASGYLLKGASVPELVGAVRTVASGGSILNPEVMNKVIKLFNHMAWENSFEDASFGQNSSEFAPKHSSLAAKEQTHRKGAEKQSANGKVPSATPDQVLSRTERNVARLVGQGYSNKEIADKLSLTSGTVRNNLSSALSKLNLRGRTQLAIWAVQTGLSSGTINASDAEDK